MKPIWHITALALVAAASLGCMSPPKPVKDTADNAAWMMLELGKELRQFKHANEVSDNSVRELLRELGSRTAANRMALNQDIRAIEAAGDSQTVLLFGRLKAQADGLQQDDALLAEQLAKLNEQMAALLKPLPDVAAKLTTAAGAVSTLGQDLPDRTVFEESRAIWIAVKNNTKENRDKLKKALAATP